MQEASRPIIVRTVCRHTSRFYHLELARFRSFGEIHALLQLEASEAHGFAIPQWSPLNMNLSTLGGNSCLDSARSCLLLQPQPSSSQHPSALDQSV